LTYKEDEKVGKNAPKTDKEPKTKQFNMTLPGRLPDSRAVTDRQKEEVIHKLFRLWLQMPYLRLGQLIGNAVEESQLYYLEDYELLERLEDSYNSNQRDRKVAFSMAVDDLFADVPDEKEAL
jgi:hypothetical protein